jgi:alpha-glucosidase
VLETYRAMIAYRRATPALMTGATRFHDLQEPLLAFTRGDSLLCVFNLSPDPKNVTLAGPASVSGPSLAATLTGQTLTLGPNAAAFLILANPSLADPFIDDPTNLTD